MRTFLPILALAVATAPAGADIGLHAAADAFRQAEALSLADGGTLWGLPLYGPMLFVDPVTRHVVANEADEQDLLRLVLDANVWTGTLPEDMPIANTATEWAGKRWTMLLWPLPSLPYERGKLLMHELFHRIQPDLGHPTRDVTCPHLDRGGRRWLRLEMRALSEALIRSGEERRTALGDALLFRRKRHEAFPDNREAILEFNEGLAEYTGFKLCGLPAPVVPDRVAVQLGQYDGRTSFARSFAYATGPAYAVLLDDIDAKWRSALTPNADVAALATKAFGVTPDSSAAAPGLRAARYGDLVIAAEEAARLATIEATERRYEARFVTGPTLTLPAMEAFNYSFNPNAVDGFGKNGTVYRGAHVTDAWGSLQVDESGVLMRRNDAGLITGCVVPAPTAAGTSPLQGAGWTLELAEGFTLAAGERPGDLRVVKTGS